MGNKNYNNNDGKSHMNINNESSSKYQLVFHFPNYKNDCINSIDIFNDKVAIGTIMGYVYLLRVDKNNLDVKKNINETNNKNLIDNSYSEKNNMISNESSSRRNKKFHIKLNKKEDDENYINSYTYKKLNKKEDAKESQTIDVTNDISKTKTNVKKIKMIKLNNKIEESFNENTDLKSSKRRKNNIQKNKIQNKDKKNVNNKMRDVTNIEDEDEKNNEAVICNKKDSKNEKSIKSDINNEKNIEEKIDKFPQISKLIDETSENICCIQFDTEEKLNISIGDLEIIRYLDVHKINMNDSNTIYNYIKIKNYESVNKHIKYCENTICMMNSTNFLIIFTDFGNYNCELKSAKIKYNNIEFNTGRKFSGKINMHNFSVPFDFDGEDFLFLDNISKEDRLICLFDTINNQFFYKYKISRNFGHISHMKILMLKEKKIFLCRNDLQCEIHSLDDNFTCIESFEHIGDDILNVFIYFKESKINEEFKQKIKDEKNKNILKLSNKNYEDYIKINNNKSKTNIKLNDVIIIKNKNNEKITLEKNNEINNNNINDNNILNMNYLSSNQNKTDKNVNEIKLRIKEESDNSNIKEMNSHSKNLNLKNSTIQIFNKNNLNEESKEPLNEEKKIKNKHKQDILTLKVDEDKRNTIEVKDKKDIINYYIFVLDNNGNLNMYKNKKNRTLFNLYNIEGIDESYFEKKFFSIGYPYYFVVNELYFAITTDFGLFVISNKNKYL